MIRILVVDDHPIVRAGIVGILAGAPDMSVVGEATDGDEAATMADATRPDVVLMDLRMPRVDGVAATERIVAKAAADGRTVRVLILTTYESDAQILAAIEAGASGYLLKAAPQDEILAGIRSVASGQTALAPSVAAMLVHRLHQREPETTLSPRELEVLRLVARGLSNKQVGARLFIGEATVKTHLAKVFEKLGVTDRTRAVTRAIELGLLQH